MKRVSAIIDGFNLYHAIEKTKDYGDNNYLKWIDLQALVKTFMLTDFLGTRDHQLVSVKYCTAYETCDLTGPDKLAKYHRHRAFVAAQEALGVEVIFGKFKPRDRYCPKAGCGHVWTKPEEKETDVNVAIHAVKGALRDEYDTLLLMSADSDQSPAVRMIRAETKKTVRLVFPFRKNSSDLISAAGGVDNLRRMKLRHLEKCIMGEQVKNQLGAVVVTRPPEYDPPK